MSDQIELVNQSYKKTVASKPPLPQGWTCHPSKSIPGRCYYFNRFTGVTTWDLGDLLPGHSDHPVAKIPGTEIPQSSSIGDEQQRHVTQQMGRLPPIYQANIQQQPVSSLTRYQNPPYQKFQTAHQQQAQGVKDKHHNNNILSQEHQYQVNRAKDFLLPAHLKDSPFTQGQPLRRSRLTGPPLPPVPLQMPCREESNSAVAVDDMSSLGVEELQAMLTEKKRKIEQMMSASQSSTHSIDGSLDNSSEESGFVSLVKEEEGRVLERNSRGTRQQELTEQEGLYRKWGDLGDLKPKSRKIDAENKDSRLEGNDLTNTIVDLNSNNNSTSKDLNSDIGNGRDEHDSDSDSLSDSLCVADSEELAVLANLSKKYPEDKTNSSKTGVTNDSQQLSPSPPDLLLYDYDCQFSPEPDSNEEEEFSESEA